VLSILRRLSTGLYPHLLLSAGACSTAPAAIHRYLLPTGRSAANPLAAVATYDRSMGQTGGRTDAQFRYMSKDLALRLISQISGEGAVPVTTE